MTVLVSDIIVLPRDSLRDKEVAKTWSDAELLGYAKTAVNLVYKRSPWLFLGAYPFAGAGAYTTGSAIPFDDVYARCLSYYVIAMAQGADEEYAVNGVASNWMALFDREFPP